MGLETPEQSGPVQDAALEIKLIEDGTMRRTEHAYNTGEQGHNTHTHTHIHTHIRAYTHIPTVKQRPVVTRKIQPVKYRGNGFLRVLRKA